MFISVECGADPSLNVKLEHLIERAKAANMTKDKIESAIKSGVKVANYWYHNIFLFHEKCYISPFVVSLSLLLSVSEAAY